MAITFVGSDGAYDGNGGTGSGITLTLPTHLADDFGVAFVNYDSSTIGISEVTAGGWTELFDGGVQGDRYACFYKKFTSASETNPEFEGDSSAQRLSATVHTFRGVHTTNPIDNSYTSGDGTNDSTPPNVSITTTTNNCCIFVNHSYVAYNYVSADGAPSGYTLSANSTLLSTTAACNFNAYLLDAGSSGTESPGSWTHTNTNVQKYYTTTIALRLNVTTHVGDGSFTGDGTLSGSSLVSKVGAGSTTSDGTLVGAGLVSKVAVGSANTSATLVGSGVKVLNTTGSIQAVASLQGDGTTTQVFSGSGSIGTTVALGGNVTVDIKSEGSIVTSSTISGNAVSILKAYANVNTSVYLTGVVGLRFSAAGNINTISTLAGGYTFHKVSKGTDTVYTTQTPTQTIYIVGEET